MARAINENATDLVGLGRPLAAEPRLCADILSGASKGAKPNAVKEQIQTGASILQIVEVCFLLVYFHSYVAHVFSDCRW